MEISRTIVLLAGIFTASVMLHPNAFGQLSDWSRIQKLAPNTPVIVKPRGSSTIKGHIRSVDDLSMAVDTNHGVRRLERRQVERIYLGEPKKRNGSKLVTALVGFGALFALGALDTRISPDWPTVLPILGAAAAAGLVQKQATKGFKRGELIYRTR
jgi:small nuclear ribonucleoprotein (snRNP)-like protein